MTKVITCREITLPRARVTCTLSKQASYPVNCWYIEGSTTVMKNYSICLSCTALATFLLTENPSHLTFVCYLPCHVSVTYMSPIYRLWLSPLANAVHQAANCADKSTFHKQVYTTFITTPQAQSSVTTTTITENTHHSIFSNEVTLFSKY